MTRHRNRWRGFFILAALEAGVALIILARIPREQAVYSLPRIALLAFLLILLALWAIYALRPPAFLEKPAHPLAIGTSVLIAIGLAIIIFLLRYLDPIALQTVYQRVRVPLFYLLALMVQATVMFTVNRFGLRSLLLVPPKSTLFSSGWALAVLMLCLVVVSATHLGLTPDSAYWGEPGVPIMGWQLALAILLGVTTFGFERIRRGTSNADLWIAGGLWLTAVTLWLGVPVSVMQNSFYMPISPPTGQPLPNSDAGYYDSMAQSLLIGHPYQGEIPTRPLYIVLLTILHLVVGEHFDLIIAGQTLVLALIPVLLYLLGRRLHSPAAGLTIALIAIFRELNSLLISSQTRVSNTKTLLADLPTLLLMLTACLMVFRWLESKDSRGATLAGFVFGLLLLLRTQVVVILPFLVLLAILAYGVRNRTWISGLFSFIAAAGMTILPWLLHNYLLSGQVSMDASFQYRIIASQYRYTGNLDIDNAGFEGNSLLGIMLAFGLRNPSFVLGFISNHFFATQIGGLLALPLIEPYNGLLADINLYWLRWNGNISWFNLAILIAYLGIIAVGLGAMWNRFRWAGLTPLAFSLGYSFANGLGRFSGWRYDLPADWIWYFYFGIGIAEILGARILQSGAAAKEVFTPPPASPHPARRSLGGVFPLAFFVLVGSLPWFAEGISKPLFANQSAEELIDQISSTPEVQNLAGRPSRVEGFATSTGAIVQTGRVLYPRYFSRGRGLASAHPWPAYAPREFPRLGFILLNSTRHDVIFPSQKLPIPFQHGVDAIVLGCQRSDYIEARLIVFLDSDLAYLSDPLDKPCN